MRLDTLSDVPLTFDIIQLVVENPQMWAIFNSTLDQLREEAKRRRKTSNLAWEPSCAHS